MENTTINLCYVKWDSEYKDVLYFSNRQNQNNFFKNLTPKKTFNDYQYSRKDSYVDVELNIDEAYKFNYIYYKNSLNKRFYFNFIDEYVYLNDNVTRLFYKCDVFQTWLIDVTFNKCLIEREHTYTDNVGDHIIDENLPIPEYKILDEKSANLNDECVIILASTIYPSDHSRSAVGIYGGIFSGCGYFAYANNTDDITNLALDIQNLVNDGKGDAITGIFMCPKKFTPGEIPENRKLPNTTKYQMDLNIKKFTASELDIKNQKLLCYPYSYYLITNGAGSSLELKPELFDESKENNTIRITACITPSISSIATPLHYDGSEIENKQQIIGLAKYPQCNYQTDQFINWLTENGINIAANTVSNVLNLPFNPIGSTSSILNAFAGVHNADRVPPTLKGNTNNGDINFANEFLDFTIYRMTIPYNYLKILDDYFEKYGYRVNKFDKPSFLNRPYWNYIKMGECNCYSDKGVPLSDIKLIKSAFLNGITFWNEYNEMYNYNLDNSLLSLD